MQTQIKAWGNSQAIRLSKEMLEMAGMKVNDVVSIEIKEGKIVIYKKPVHMTLEERAKSTGLSLVVDRDFDWGEPVGREIW